MVNPFGAIFKTNYPKFKQMGFRIVRDGDYHTILSSSDSTISLSVERYTPADIELSFIGDQGEIYPLWMIRLLLDVQQYNQDKAKLHLIRDEHGLQDGSQGMAVFRRGVKLYTSTYIEMAVHFLQNNLHRVNLNKDDFKTKLVMYSSGSH